MHEEIANAYSLIKSQLGGAELLAVSKKQPLEKIIFCYQLGQRLFAENYAQEGARKVQQLRHLDDIQWHFIGQLQSNKTKLIAAHFNWVQSIDRYKIAERLSLHCQEFNKNLQICIALNIDNEPQKAGVCASLLPQLAQQIEQLPNLKLRGLMVIPSPRKNADERLAVFNKVKQVFDELNVAGHNLDTLSMGMSGDYHEAITAGSTMVRIGTSLFGARDET